MADRVAFTPAAAKRIARAVIGFETLDRDNNGMSLGSVPDAVAPPLRLGTFTGAWSTGTYKTVTLTGSTLTASVFNWTRTVASADSACQRYVIFGNVRGTQSAVEIQMQATCDTCVTTFGGVDLSSLAGYASGEIQILGHSSAGACLQWYSITTCGTSTATP